MQISSASRMILVILAKHIAKFPNMGICAYKYWKIFLSMTPSYRYSARWSNRKMSPNSVILCKFRSIDTMKLLSRKHLQKGNSLSITSKSWGSLIWKSHAVLFSLMGSMPWFGQNTIHCRVHGPNFVIEHTLILTQIINLNIHSRYSTVHCNCHKEY